MDLNLNSNSNSVPTLNTRGLGLAAVGCWLTCTGVELLDREEWRVETQTGGCEHDPNSVYRLWCLVDEEDRELFCDLEESCLQDTTAAAVPHSQTEELKTHV